ncbi:MAG: hypothetical protein AAFZ92_07015 [Pseudomonadota bacterium]
MKLDVIELRTLKYYLSKAYEAEKATLKNMEEDSDEYMELANDLMILDTLISKIVKAKPNEQR